MQWIPFAMVRIAAVFIAGILFSIYYPGIISEKWATILLLFSVLFYFLARLLLNRSPVIKVVTGFLGLGAIGIAGYLNVILKNESHQADHLIQAKEKIIAYTVKLISSSEEKAKSLRRIGEIQFICTEKGWRRATGNINLFWPKTEPVARLDYGDVLLITGSPRELDPPYNPNEFDFRKFLHFKYIYHQQYVRHDEWTLVEKSTDKRFLFYAHRARSWSVEVIKKFISSQREQAIVIALVLGVTDGLDNELQNAYAASGAMHVLAVSGLHVSIIYGILLFFFKPLGNASTGRWIVAIVSLTLLWAYAFITGLSPSVLRAVAMFSFVAIAKPVGRNTNIYNTLAASAFFLLLYDPYLIMSVGFQLSYLAVLGIVYLQRPIYNLWEAKSALLNWAWQCTCVSIAAQIATFALGLFYFHQFPIYFLLANLFVIPASFVILVAGILLLMVSPFAPVASLIGIALEIFVKITNDGVFLVEQLPYSLINNISISGFQCFLLFLLIAGGLLLIQFRKFQFIIFMTFCVFLFSLESWHRSFKVIEKSKWTVYRVPGHSALEWSENAQSLFVADSSLLLDIRNMRFHIQPNRLINGITNVREVTTSRHFGKGLQFYHRKGKTFLLIESKEFRLPESLSVDYLVIGNNSIQSLSAIYNHLKFRYLILDSSNSNHYCERMEKEALDMNLVYYSVLKSGAFILDL